jgi:hypothetical protein
LYVIADKSEQLLGVLALTQRLFIKFLGVSSQIRCGTSVVAKITDVLECAAKEVNALVEARRDVEKRSAEPLPEWMTAVQLARYWQLINASGEAITAGIMKWTKRAENEHPLPHACMGDLLRFKREEADRWAKEEAGLRRAEKNRKKLHLAS